MGAYTALEISVTERPQGKLTEGLKSTPRLKGSAISGVKIGFAAALTNPV